MKKRSRLACMAGVASLLSPVAIAQTTWVVDQNGGPGSHFTDLPPAIQASRDADTIVIRAGSGYNGVSTRKSLWVIGEGMPVLTTPLMIKDLPARHTFVVRGIELRDTELMVTNCIGSVHIDSVGGTGLALVIDASDHVSIANSRFESHRGDAPIRIDRSTVTLSDVSADGADATATAASHSALRAADSVVAIAGGLLRGGAELGASPGSPAIVHSRGELVLTGTSSTLFTAGTSTGSLAAVVADGGIVRIDRRVRLRAFGNSPTIVGTSPVRWMPIPAMFAGGAPPGGTIPATSVGTAGQLAALVVGLPSPPVHTSYGTMWVDPATSVPVDFGVIGPTGFRTVKVPLPDFVGLRGWPLTFQAAVGTSAATINVSPAATIVVQ